MNEHHFTSIDDARAFALAGNAILTLQSLRTGTHYTYRVKQATNQQTQEPQPGVYFVNLLTSGSADDDGFTYLGLIRRGAFGLTAKSHMTLDSGPVKAFRFFLQAKQLHADLVVRHEGRCGRCGRTLTVPESIDSGLGPECREIYASRSLR
jgi:Family of unknown function (DUF6011)